MALDLHLLATLPDVSHRRVDAGDVARNGPRDFRRLRDTLVGLPHPGRSLRDVAGHVLGHRRLLLDGRGDAGHDPAHVLDHGR